jgi:thioredoxin 1
MDSDDRATRWVFGLCAQWCGVCREWREAFDSVAARNPQDRFAWIDVEDEDELVGDLDIETFPTLLVGTAQKVLFFGTILPSPDLLARLLTSLEGDSGSGSTPEIQALLQRLVTRQL